MIRGTFKFKNVVIYEDLNKNYIFKYVTQSQIFERYLNITVPDNPNEFIHNPLRRDENPTVTFKWFGDKLRMKDWSGFFYGDCFDLVAFILQVNAQTKFFLVLEDICRVFSLREYSTVDVHHSLELSKKFETKLKLNSYNKPEISYSLVRRPFSNRDRDYWAKYKVINKKVLDTYKVYPLKALYSNSKTIYLDSLSELCYAYDDNNTYQFYFPKRKKGQIRFISTKYTLKLVDFVEGNKELLVITKSRKDAMCILAVTKHLNLSVDVIYVPAENYLLTISDLELIKSLGYGKVITLFDNDFTGKNLAKKYKNLFNIDALIIKTSKDFSQFCVDNSLKLILEIVKKTYKHYVWNNLKKD